MHAGINVRRVPGTTSKRAVQLLMLEIDHKQKFVVVSPVYALPSFKVYPIDEQEMRLVQNRALKRPA